MQLTSAVVRADGGQLWEYQYPVLFLSNMIVVSFVTFNMFKFLISATCLRCDWKYYVFFRFVRFFTGEKFRKSVKIRATAIDFGGPVFLWDTMYWRGLVTRLLIGTRKWMIFWRDFALKSTGRWRSEMSWWRHCLWMTSPGTCSVPRYRKPRGGDRWWTDCRRIRLRTRACGNLIKELDVRSTDSLRLNICGQRLSADP